MRGLEERLGVRLLARTTRSVAPTEAGERLLHDISPHLSQIDLAVAGLQDVREQPAGTIRLTANEHAANTILYPRIAPLLALYPDLHIEISVDNAFTDIVEHRFDAGVRLGDMIDKDMIALRIGPEMCMAVVGSPAYFAQNPAPVTPHDLVHHNCIGMRLPTYGNILGWEFDKDGESITVRPDGQFIANSTSLGLRALLDGRGLGYVPEDLVAEGLATGSLLRVLSDWCEPFPGYYLYYPSRRQPSAIFTLLVDALRYRDGGT